MKANYSILAILIPQAILVHCNTDFVTLTTSNAVWIQEAEATVILPQLPNPVLGHNSLWSAIYTDSNKSFMQGVSAIGPGE